ncbi:MAG: nucleotidyltransferase domain-containing protein [Anaerolineae bacterium]
MDREVTLVWALDYAQRLAGEHPGILAVILGGSLARSDQLPSSDLDLLYFSEAPLPLRPHNDAGLFVDIDHQPAAYLADPQALRQPFFCGYLADALVLVDPSGVAARCHVAAKDALLCGRFRDDHLAVFRAALAHSTADFTRAMSAGDDLAFCPALSDTLNAVIDLHLVHRGISPGGSRALARLRAVEPATSARIAALETAEESVAVGDWAVVSELVAALSTASAFFTSLGARALWLTDHGYSIDGRHALWCALGAYITHVCPGLDAARRQRFSQALARWLAQVGWGSDVRQWKVADVLRLTQAETSSTGTAG